MNASPALLARLKKHEGYRAMPYRDSLGFWTIGYGHLITRDKHVPPSEARRLSGGPWTEAKSTAVLQADIELARTALADRLPWLATLDAAAQEALIELAFNLGVDGLLGFRKMLAALKTGDRDTACEELRDSLWYHQVGPHRYKAIKELLHANP